GSGRIPLRAPCAVRRGTPAAGPGAAPGSNRTGRRRATAGSRAGPKRSARHARRRRTRIVEPSRDLLSGHASAGLARGAAGSSDGEGTAGLADIARELVGRLAHAGALRRDARRSDRAHGQITVGARDGAARTAARIAGASSLT